MEHEFTKEIKKFLQKNWGQVSELIFDRSQLLQYLNIKTKSANKGSKSRSSFANLYAIYVLVEDYISKSFHKNSGYSDYEGAVYKNLMRRQRELPFGQKLQNHALNGRMNDEFKKFFPNCEFLPPIIRDVAKTKRYWFNENLLKLTLNGREYNIAETVIEIIDAYVEAKRDSFEKFIQLCKNADDLPEDKIIDFIKELVEPTADARIFEIVSYSILKSYYDERIIYWGYDLENLKRENLKLFKTGRTNANDGGIDFVMKPLGRFFQVTETVDANKYFLDIDKIEKYPITFVVKSSELEETIREKIASQAKKNYSINAIVLKYMDCIEEIINIPSLLEKFEVAVSKGYLKNILTEILKQSQLEFNYEIEENNFDIELLEDSAEET